MTPWSRSRPLTKAALVATTLLLFSGAVPRRAGTTGASTPPRARNVLVVTLDGLRWQELFAGFTAELNSEEQGVASPEGLAQRFEASTPEARREKLLPFLWGTVAREGQVFGDPSKQSVVRVTNGRLFSYPGYGELLTGVADPRIDSNAKTVNPNVNVLEWLHRRPGFEGHRIWVAVMGPDTPALGLREGVTATQSQVAATVAYLLGEDFDGAVPAAAPPLPGVTR